MPGLIPKDFGNNDKCIIIFLNDKNLSAIKGYKAEVLMHPSVLPDKLKFRRAYITITITGLSNKAASKLQDSLEMMKPEEITEYIKEQHPEFFQLHQSEKEGSK